MNDALTEAYCSTHYMATFTTILFKHFYVTSEEEELDDQRRGPRVGGGRSGCRLSNASMSDLLFMALLENISIYSGLHFSDTLLLLLLLLLLKSEKKILERVFDSTLVLFRSFFIQF